MSRAAAKDMSMDGALAAFISELEGTDCFRGGKDVFALPSTSFGKNFVNNGGASQLTTS